MPVGNVVAEAFEREIDGAVIVEGIAQPDAGRGQAQPVFGQPLPREQLARIDLARRGDIGMPHHIGARYGVRLHDTRKQRHQRLELRVGKGAIAEFMPRMVELDADAGRIDVADTAPIAEAGMPGAAILGHQSRDLAHGRNQVMRRNLGLGIAQSRQRARGAFHFGIVDHRHGDRQRALVVIGRGLFTVDQLVAVLLAHPIRPSPSGRTAPSTSASSPRIYCSVPLQSCANR